MTTPDAVFRQAEAQGVKLWADVGALRYSGPQSAVSALLPEIRRHKSALLALVAGKRAEPAPLPTRWRVIHQGGVVRELDAPSGLSEAEARELAERLGGPVASLAPVAVESPRTNYQPPTDRNVIPDPNAIAAELAREHGISAAAALALLDDGDKAAIRAGDPAMLAAWKSAVALVARAGPPLESDPVLCRDCRHWTPDRINPPAGLGRCDGGSRTLAWPASSCSKGEPA